MKTISTLASIVIAGLLSSCAVQPTQPAANNDALYTPAQVAEMVAKAEAGDLKAQEELCASGPASNSHYKPADQGMRMCEMAAAQGSIYAMLDISSRYDMGLGVDIAPAKSYEWLTRATQVKPAEDDIYGAEAYGAMANAHELGLYGLKPDPRAAFKWHLKAAAQGWTNSYLPLAKMYESGIGTRQDFKAAAKWYLAAAENGSYEGAHALALAYIKGQGVTRDLRKAFFWDSVGDRLAQKYTNCSGSCPHGIFPYYFGHVPQAELDAIKAQADAWETGKQHP